MSATGIARPIYRKGFSPKEGFAHLMAIARERKLTSTESQRLTEFRQMLRRAKRPAMNPGVVVKKVGAKWGVFRRDEENDLILVGYLKYDTKEDALKAARDYVRSKSGRFLETNPRKTYRKPYHSLEPQIFESMAYRGYLIKFNALRDEYWIEKDRAFIAYAQTITEAKKKIDSIFGENPRRAKRNPSRSLQRLGRAVEVRYRREIGRQPGYYKHVIKSRRAGLYTVPAGWFYVSGKSIVITEGKPHV